MDIKNKNLYYLKICMSVINFVILAFFSAVSGYTCLLYTSPSPRDS